MKVLWFTNTPCSAVDKLKLKIYSGGWLRSLEEELHKVPSVDLAISFYTQQNFKSFNYNGTLFYPIFRKGTGSKFDRFIKRSGFSKKNNQIEVQELLSVIEKFNPDIIHIHGTENDFGIIQTFTTIPIVFSLQGILSSIVEKFFSGIPYKVASKHEDKLNKITITNIRFYYRNIKKMACFEHQVLKNAKYIIGRTHWDKRISNILAPKAKYFQINEMLRPVFYSKEWQKDHFNNIIQIVTITSDSLFKGFENIVNTALILKYSTNLNFTWKVIGVDEKSAVVKIVKKWKKKEFDDLNIQLFGILSEFEIVRVLTESDIYCQTSHIENSPNSLCEAMMLGMPVIATFAGGTSSILENDKEGLLIQDGDCYLTAGSILELITDLKKACEMGKKARERALDRHNKSNILNSILNAYENIIKTQNSNKEVLNEEKVEHFKIVQ